MIEADRMSLVCGFSQETKSQSRQSDMRVLQLKIDMKKKEFQQQEEKNKMLMAKAGKVPYEYYN